MRIRILITALLSLLLLSCSDKKKDKLSQRERDLLQREEEFAAKEADYSSLLELRDSLRAADSLKMAVSITSPKIWPDSLAGTWNGKLVCRETACTTYVIGDQRTEKWIFDTDSLGLRVKVMDNEKLKRILRADLVKQRVSLSFTSDSAAANKIKIDALLDNFGKKVVSGSQTLVTPDNCAVKFSVELTPATKQ